MSYQPNLCKPDVCITNKLGLSKAIYTYSDLLEEIQSQEGASAPLSTETLSLKYGWLDGQSTKRVYHFLQEVVER